MKTVDVLKKARQLLVRRNWCQGAFGFDSNGNKLFAGDNLGKAVSLCLLGACYAVAPSLAEVVAAEKVLEKTLAKDISLSGWNDMPRRTKQQVLNLFTRTIKRLSNA